MDHQNILGGLQYEAVALLLTTGGLMDYLPKFALILGCLWYLANLSDWLVRKIHHYRKGKS